MLSNNQRDYIFYHLNHHIEGLGLIKRYLCFKMPDNSSVSYIYFPLSEQLFNKEAVSFISDLPVLFPCSSKQQFFHLTPEGNLVFEHDLLRSAFYLLSGQQEYESREEVLKNGRYRYSDSIHKQLGICNKSIVNYYFDVIIDGLLQFAEFHGLKLKRKRLFNQFGFLLTHDVDRVKYFSYRETIYRWLQVFGLRKAHYPLKRLRKAAIASVLPTIFSCLAHDPYWSFRRLRKVEKLAGFKSVWYFLNRDGSPHDARYYFSDTRIREEMDVLLKDGCEVGLHASIKASEDAEAMSMAVRELKENLNVPVVGVRQHFLRFIMPDTFFHQQKTGLRYDTTLGFAEREGFRNSYCWPFKPYDHENDRMMDIWEFPLALMDATLFEYREQDYNQIEGSLDVLIQEVKKFGGLLVLLWHNCNTDEYYRPGITHFYKRLIWLIKAQDPESILGKELVDRMNDMEQFNQ
ncbi:hypothetical protein DMA11_17950 [Marinilabiliaceae bacterium JC017]|nr:hypothetical protein DMA11_17950 [Marinilabiliaceae bacterium JC017]